MVVSHTSKLSVHFSRIFSNAVMYYVQAPLVVCSIGGYYGGRGGNLYDRREGHLLGRRLIGRHSIHAAGPCRSSQRPPSRGGQKKYKGARNAHPCLSTGCRFCEGGNLNFKFLLYFPGREWFVIVGGTGNKVHPPFPP